MTEQTSAVPTFKLVLGKFSCFAPELRQVGFMSYDCSDRGYP